MDSFKLSQFGVLEKLTVNFVCGETHADLEFKFPLTEDTSRVFKMKRSATEEMTALFSRIKTSIQKSIKQGKKGKKVKSNDGSADSVDVKLFQSNAKVTSIAQSTDKDVIFRNVCVDNMTCSDAFIENEDHFYYLLIQKTLYFVELNPPTVVSCKLSSNMMTHHYQYPNELVMSNASLSLSHYHWYASLRCYDTLSGVDMETVEWRRVAEDFAFKPTQDMIGHVLKVVITPEEENKPTGDSFEAVSACLVKAGPNWCPYFDRISETNETLGSDSVRVVSYNILADVYASTEDSAKRLYPYCPAEALSIDYRKQLLLGEILGYNADIVCLQEVDDRVFEFDLNKALPIITKGRLQGVYTPKLGGKIREGSALLYNSQKFMFLNKEEYQLSEEVQSNAILSSVWAKIQQNANLKERFISRSSVLQLTSLSLRGREEEVLLVGNTHLYFHPNADHIRLLQTIICSLLMEEAVKKHTHMGRKVRMLFCGDLNSTPDTGVFDLLSEGRVKDTHPGWNSFPDESITPFDHSQSLTLCSACGTPPYTNYVQAFNGCLDYIFYQKEQFNLQKVVALPSHATVTANTALPSTLIPSDHLALVAELNFT